MIRNKAYRLLGPTLLMALVLVLFSCSTKKNSFTRRMYHNLTSHYNVYWNGKEAMIQAEKDLQASVKDNYNLILPVYNFGTETESKAITPLLDRSIEKGSKTILKHSMRFGAKEYVKWIDDAYMLIGKAYFYKQDYFSARRSFSFVMREYEDNPIKYNAMLWLARTYIALEQFERSEPLLNLIQADISYEKAIPLDVLKEFPLVNADQFIKQGYYDRAIDYLYDGIAVVGDKQLKTRAKFILAQIYQEEGDLEMASQLYAEVIKRNPIYEMAFQSKINLARAYQAGDSDSKTIIKYLTRMLRDDKNKEYLDQIYYALAEVAFTDQQDSLGMDYLRLSVARSVSNDFQKSTSALDLADIYFEIPEYELSQAYYDTAVTYLPVDFPNYEEIKNRADKLSDLVGNLTVIQVEDSLQMLAAMSAEERYEIIDQIIADLIEEEQRQREADELAQTMAGFDQGVSSGFNTGVPIGGAKWYFYNPNALSNGYSEFIRKWGKRKLEDLWRLRDKQVIDIEFEDPLEGTRDSLALAGDTLGIKALDAHNREYYIKNIPFTVEAIAKSDKAIAEAYYNLGLIYAEGLNDTRKSINAYETLIERFPNDPNKLKVYYQLYRLYMDVGNSAQSDYYKNLITTEYPDSDYAKLILDPDYFKNLMAQASELTTLYSTTYTAFERGQYYTVIGNADRAIRTYGDTNELIPKFLYLKALSVGKVDVVDSLAVVLKLIITDYPNSEIKPLAQDLLSYISKDRPDLGGASSQTAQQDTTLMNSPYTYDPASIHLYLLVVKRQAVKLNAMKVKISDHNKKYYSIRSLTINSVLLDDNRYMITVGNFEDAKDALSYLKTITGDLYVFSDLGTGNFDEAVISMKNYPIFYKDKGVNLYMRFFEKNYLK